ncbi:MAG: DUF4080 domain-containing protein [Lachnospiraceae bacterium]|nr:DUF4080 domain-containing protein [Lachnospiraceae bacterium]
MNFLLVGINAKYIHLNPALYSLKYSVPEELRGHVTVAEYTINHVYEKILMDIVRRQPDVIGISCYIWNAETVKKLCGDLAKVLPEVPIWLGGPEAAWSDDGVFAELPIDGVMCGEGEMVFPGVLEAYLAVGTAALGQESEQNTPAEAPCRKYDDGNQLAKLNSMLRKIAGLRYRDVSGIIVSTGIPATADMDRLPFIYDKQEDFSNRIVYYESSRGCPFHCSYCLSASDKRMRYRSLSLVLSELQWFLEQRVPQVKFLDRTFNSDRQRTAAIWRYLLEHDNGVTNFHFEITADLMGQEEIDLLKKMRPGLVQLEIGVQSTNPDTLRAINRRADVQRLSEVVAAINFGGNVHQHLDLIAGLPYEDMDSFATSFNEVYGMHPSQLQLGFLKVLKGSPIALQTEEFGIVYRDNAPYEVLATRWLSYPDVIRLKGIEEMVETYYNSHQFELTLSALEREFASPFALYDALAAHGQKVNPEGKSLSRAGLFEQLRGFIHEISVNRREVFDTLLTMDYYLREHARKRPVFAVGRELPCPGHSRDYHREEIDFSLELFMQTGEVKSSREIWLFDYTRRSAISNNALLRKEIY